MSSDKDLQQAVAEAIYYHMFPDRPDTFYDDEWLYTRYYDCAGKAVEAYEAAKVNDQPVGYLSLPPAICTGCGQQPKVRVHLIGDIKICPNCIHLMMNIVEREAPELATWAALEDLQAAWNARDKCKN